MMLRAWYRAYLQCQFLHWSLYIPITAFQQEPSALCKCSIAVRVVWANWPALQSIYIWFCAPWYRPRIIVYMTFPQAIVFCILFGNFFRWWASHVVRSLLIPSQVYSLDHVLSPQYLYQISSAWQPPREKENKNAKLHRLYFVCSISKVISVILLKQIRQSEKIVLHRPLFCACQFYQCIVLRTMFYQATATHSGRM